MATEYKLSYTATQIDEKLGKIDNLATKNEVPSKTSDLTNDSGFITGYTETDPTVPDWAKKQTKPTYTASEVGADASGTASSLISAHNTATDSHSDIREAINGKLNTSELSNAINTALAQAKESGEFDGADGQPGADGLPGQDGSDGITPHIGDNGNWFIGETDTGNPSRGIPGEPGKDGKDGQDGYTPQKGIDYFDGQSGKDGEDGKDGYTPIKGKDYFDGQDGKPGEDGKDGVSATHSWNGTVLTITSASGTSSADLKGAKGDQGEKGADGAKGDQGIQGIQGEKGDKGDTGATGANGKDGTSVTVKSVSESTADGGSNVVTFSDGETLTVKNGSKGNKGDKGDPGADYVFTDADKNEILSVVRATANQQTPLFANSVAECTDTSKVYVLPDGLIYGHILTEVPPPTITIEDHADGYWKAGPTWLSASGYSAKSTNMIPVTPGDQLEYKGMGASQAISVAWFNASQTQISTAQHHNSWNATTVTLTAPTGAAYARFFSFKQVTTPSRVTLSVTWIKCQAAGTKYGWASTGHAFVPANYENRILALESSIGETASVLKGKKIVYDGDSICESRTGSSANNGGGYAKLIADCVGGTYVNQAVGGARLTTKASGASYHSVVDNLPNLPKDGDLYCFEGGINDYWTPKTLGTFSKTDFAGTLDTNTICGALETIFRYALSNFVGKPICFVIAHKIQSTAYAKNTNGDTFEDYRNAMVGICNKYSIPYYDAFSESGLNGWNTAQNNAYLTSNTNGTADGIHPNAEGYKRYYVPQLIQLFEGIMPVE